jgi:WD40 repeat protein
VRPILQTPTFGCPLPRFPATLTLRMNGSEPQGRAPPQFGFAAASTPSEHGRVAGTAVPHPSVPDHELLRPIGRGSYGQVWLARNVMGAYRAVKVVYRSAFEHDRPFEREFEGIQKFEPISRTHESQVDILHVGRNEQAAYFYYVMELADDQQTGQQINPETYAPKSLKSELYRRTRLPLEQCLRIGLSLTTALDHLHKHGLVHRDVKPSNIIFVNEIPKLADIGLVANVDATMSFVGTAGYLPPEGPGTPQADIYSLGKVLYELCTGRDRQDFPELPTEWQKFVDQQGLLEFNAVLMKACATDVRKRYQTAADMHADLALLQAGKSVKRLRLVEQRLALITRIGLAAAALSVLALGGYFGAVRQARRAERAESEMAQQLYAADINRASQFWEKGNLKRALELLESQRPASKTERDLRGFEWFYFWRLCHKDDALLTWRAGTNNELSSSFSPDAKVLATSGNDESLMLWDLASSQLLAALTNYSGGDAPRMALSWHGSMLAYRSPSGSIQLWDIRSKRPIDTLPATNRSIACIALAPGGHLLAVADAESTTINLWDVDSRILLGTLTGDRGGHVRGLAFSSDGKLLASGHRDNVVTFWDPSSRSKIGDFDVPVGFASLLVFSPDNHTLAVGGINSIVALCDVSSRKLTPGLSGHESQVNDVAFSLDGRMIATASDDTTVKLWDFNSRQLLATFKGHLSPVNTVIFDGETLISSATDGVVKQWGLGPKTNADVLLAHTNWARSVAFSPDSKTMASAGKDKTVRLWDVATRQPLSTLLGNQRPVLAVAWSSNGQFIASGSGLVTEPDGLGAVMLWDVVGRKGYITLTNQNTPVRSLAFAPDSQTLATGNGNGTVALWDVVNQRLKTTWVAHSNSVTGLAFSPDAKLLASCGDDNSVKLWDMKTLRCLAVLPGSAGNKNGYYAIWCVSFSADGKLLAAGHDDGTVTLWSIPSRKLFRTLKGTEGSVLSVAFSPDGKTLATGNRENVVTLWHLATGQEMAILHGHQGSVESVAFSPDGSILASASEDNTLRLWRAATHAEADAGR